MQAPDESTAEYDCRLDSVIGYICMPGNKQGLTEEELKHKHKLRCLINSYYNFSQSSQTPQHKEQAMQRRSMTGINGGGSGGGEYHLDIEGDPHPPLPPQL